MKLTALVRKYRAQLGDSLWSILGLVLMNAIAQVLLYPFLAKSLGKVGYGNMQYLLAYINIIAVSAGCAANLARMTADEKARMEANGDYHLFLLAIALFSVPFVWLIRRFGGVGMDARTTVAYYFLLLAMLLRYYADVAYKLTLNYRRYFVYYLIIGVGYVGGLFLFRATGIWPLALLPGEAAGVLFAYTVGPTLRRHAFRLSPAWRHAFRLVLVLLLSEGVSNLIFNADRLLLQRLIDGEAVTVYYNATLVGKMMSLITVPLAGVLIGYLARYQGGFTKKIMRTVLFSTLGVLLLGTAACFFGGYVWNYIFYRETFESVREYLLPGSFAQVLYFTTTLLTVVLIRFAKKIYQVYINGAFGLCFFGLAVPATLRFGIAGFAGAMTVAGIVRLAVAVVLGFLHAARCEKQAPEQAAPNHSEEDL